MVLQTLSPDTPAVRMAAATVNGGRAVRRGCAASRTDVLQWRCPPQSVSSGRRGGSLPGHQGTVGMDMQKTRTTPLHSQSDGLVERFHRGMEQQLTIVSAKYQRDWDAHLPLELMAYRSAVPESNSCTSALLMLGRELCTPPDLAFGQPPNSPPVPFGPEAFTAKHSQGTTGDSQVSGTQQLVVVGAGSRVSENERYELKRGIRSVHSC